MLCSASVPWGTNRLWNSTVKILRSREDSANLCGWQQLLKREWAVADQECFSGFFALCGTSGTSLHLSSFFPLFCIIKWAKLVLGPNQLSSIKLQSGTLKILDKCSASSLRLSNPWSKAYFFLVHFSLDFYFIFWLEEKCVILWLNLWAVVALQHHNLISLWTKRAVGSCGWYWSYL